jgi:hypothetical protein
MTLSRRQLAAIFAKKKARYSYLSAVHYMSLPNDVIILARGKAQDLKPSMSRLQIASLAGPRIKKPKKLRAKRNVYDVRLRDGSTQIMKVEDKSTALSDAMTKFGENNVLWARQHKE